MALAGECEDRAVMDESVDDGRCGYLVRKDLGPFLKCQVRDKDDVATFVAT